MDEQDAKEFADRLTGVLVEIAEIVTAVKRAAAEVIAGLDEDGHSTPAQF